jgi:hypothetical protein
MKVQIEVEVMGKTKTVTVDVQASSPQPIMQAFCNWRHAEYKSGNQHAWHARLIRGVV